MSVRSSLFSNMDIVVDDLDEFKQNLTLEKNIKLINGKFGKVSVWRHEPTKKLFLLKQITHGYNEIEPMIHYLMKKNKYFLNLYYSVNSPTTNILIMDYIADGDLFDLLRRESRLPEPEVRSIILQLVDALQALHKNFIIHNDVKLENVLYHRKRQIYLCDYGLCRIVGVKSCQDGTLDYFSPEKIMGRNYDFGFDWWSVGVLTYELITGTHPYKFDPDEDLTTNVLQRRQQRKLEFKPSVSIAAQSFIEKLLFYNINYRLTSGDEIKLNKFLQ
ncbi:protein kinase 1 [Cryptophlebia peltastica nucleopolyhedrovirus]|uniref:Protein kinase 1 n=1 Tax=Cryptophlebia peltastica nucleopolyhedrovirus TaxID=2304025 RepID=A0A346RNM2_9ABAC|nr:protein kinase 1 [Cryptophlebia peltastica nucleopolyhedrovirus]AXS67669.1 protein kinase 1 [Cryptophlebia peltastica nucleopolyhedrovirus]